MDTRETLMQDDSNRAKRYRQIASEYEAMAEGDRAPCKLFRRPNTSRGPSRGRVVTFTDDLGRRYDLRPAAPAFTLGSDELHLDDQPKSIVVWAKDGRWLESIEVGIPALDYATFLWLCASIAAKRFADCHGWWKRPRVVGVEKDWGTIGFQRAVASGEVAPQAHSFSLPELFSKPQGF